MLWFVFKLELKQYLHAPFRKGKHTGVTSRRISNMRAVEEQGSPLAELGHGGPDGVLTGSVWGLSPVLRLRLHEVPPLHAGKQLGLPPLLLSGFPCVPRG